MDQRIEFINEIAEREYSFAELCRRYGISRKTGYKWLGRYRTDGQRGLADRAPIAREHPNRISDRVAELLVWARGRHPTWGPRKILAWLEATAAEVELPAASSVGELFTRRGLVVPRRRGNRPSHHPRVGIVAPTGPNAIWTADYKGHFQLGNGSRCHPLTIVDGYSRYILRLDALLSEELESTRQGFQEAFQAYGLPDVVHTDNGPPFVGKARLGLSRFAVWLLHLGVRLESGRPGKPQDNAAHERMHRTLKAETTRPARWGLRAQQVAFERFRRCFNDERPHEAHGQTPPAIHYSPSPRPFPRRWPEWEYPSTAQVVRVSVNGGMRWKGHDLFIGEGIGGELVAVEEADYGCWRISLGPQSLGTFDEEYPERGIELPEAVPES